MARIRSIHPGAPLDEDVATMSLAARYVWAYLPCHADREGRLKDSAFTLKAAILPGDSVDMETILVELAQRGLIVRYRVSDRRFIQIRNFARYQNPHKNEIQSSIPGPDQTPAPAKAAPDSWIYFARNEATGAIKIGRSRLVEARMCDLQVGSVDRIVLLGVMAGGSDEERGLHAKFADLRERGEWFRASTELLDFIEENTLAEFPEPIRKALEKYGTAPAVRSGPDPSPSPGPIDSEGGPRAHVRSNGDAGPIPIDPVHPDQRRWPAEEWFEAFRMQWLTYQKGSYGGRPNDFSAVGDLRTILSHLPLEEALAAQKRSSQMFAEYFGDRREEVAAARHPWSWFVQRFDGIRFPKKSAPPDDRCAFHRAYGTRGKVPPRGAHDSCPECKHAQALKGDRRSEPTPAGDALIASTDRKVAELHAAAQKAWTPEQRAEFEETMRAARQPAKAATA